MMMGWVWSTFIHDFELRLYTGLSIFFFVLVERRIYGRAFHRKGAACLVRGP